MLRKLIAVVVSSAFLMTSIAAGAAEPAKPAPAPTSTPQTAGTTKNQPPLPPGRARDIKKAQGLEDDDLGPGVIIGSIAAATGLLIWLMFKDDDDSSSSTGTN